jgi:hypothetical protein
MNACAMLRKSKDPVRALLWRQRLSKTAYYAWMNRCRVVQVAAAWTRTRAEQPPPEVNLGRFLWIAADRRFELFDYTVLESWRWHCCKLREEATLSIDTQHERRQRWVRMKIRYVDTKIRFERSNPTRAFPMMSNGLLDVGQVCLSRSTV